MGSATATAASSAAAAKLLICILRRQKSRYGNRQQAGKLTEAGPVADSQRPTSKKFLLHVEVVSCGPCRWVF